MLGIFVSRWVSSCVRIWNNLFVFLTGFFVVLDLFREELGLLDISTNFKSCSFVKNDVLHKKNNTRSSLESYRMDKKSIIHALKFWLFRKRYANPTKNGLGSVLGCLRGWFGEVAGASWTLLGATLLLFARLSGTLGHILGTSWLPWAPFKRLLTLWANS